MDKPQSFIIDNENVYIAQDIYNYDTAFFTGVCGRTRLIVEKLKLKESDYCWGYIKNNIWIKSNPKYPKAKLLLFEEYVINNVPKMMDKVKQELYKYEEAPSILELTNDEKFKDNNNKIINIEIRGERESSKCYFKVKDISIGFNMPSLQDTLIREKSNYELNLHYKFFTIKKSGIGGILSSKKYLFLTYKGMLKVLFTSRTGNAEAFQSWATDKLFTVHLGTLESKQELSAQLMGVNVNNIRDVFTANISKTPTVYLFMIGNASELLKGDYDKDDILCKYGCTKDISRRSEEHQKVFKKEFNKDIELLCFSIIEPQYIFNAESSISSYFKSDKIEYGKHKELIVINKKHINQIKDHYRMIQNSYIGCFEELRNKIIELEKEIINEKNINNLKDKEIELIIEKHKNEIKDKVLELRDKDLELRNKDVALLEYKIKYLESLHN
jgi:hypothetical protein